MLPIRLEMQDFMSHEKSAIDFSFNSCLISGDNGAGKSTILEAIGFCLFGKSRQKISADVVRRGQPSCSVTFVFEHGGKRYRVTRTKNAKYASLDDVGFFEVTDSGDVQAQGDTNSEINEKIKSTIKSNYDVFSNTAYFMQNSFFEFMEGAASARQKLVTTLLNLDRWDDYAESTNDSLKEVNKNLDVLALRLEDFKTLEADLTRSQKLIVKAHSGLETLSGEEQILKDDVFNITAKINEVSVSNQMFVNYHELKSKESILESKERDLAQQISMKERGRAEIEQNSINGVAQCKDIDEKIAELSDIFSLKGAFNIEEMEKKLVVGRTKLEMLDSQIHNLKENDVCQECDSVLGDQTTRNVKIDAKHLEAKAIRDKILRAEDVLAKARATDTKIKRAELEAEKYISRKSKIEQSLDTNIIKIQSLSNEIDTLKKSCANVQLELEGVRTSLVQMGQIFSTGSIDDLKEQLGVKSTRLKEVTQEREKLLAQIGSLTASIDRINSDLTKKEGLITSQSEAKKKSYIYSTLVKAFSKNGIQATIVDNIIEQLGVATNDFLNEFSSTPMHVNFITQKKDTKGSWKETLDIEIVTPTGVSSFESLSGGERFRVTFAIRMALNVLQNKRLGGGTQLLLLDEVSSSLDEVGLDIFVSIIKKLEKRMKIMVITHDASLKDMFDHIIYVNKAGAVSEISQT